MCVAPGSLCGEVTCPDMDIHTDSGGEGLTITCDNTVLTCNGTRFIGKNASTDPADQHMRAIEIIGENNVTIQGCEFVNFTYGAYLQDTEGVILRNNSFHNNYENIHFKDKVYGTLIYNNSFFDYNSTQWRSDDYGNSSWTGSFANTSVSINFTGGPTFMSYDMYKRKYLQSMEQNKVYDNYFGDINGPGAARRHIYLNPGSDTNNISSNRFVNSTSDMNIFYIILPGPVLL